MSSETWIKIKLGVGAVVLIGLFSIVFATFTYFKMNREEDHLRRESYRLSRTIKVVSPEEQEIRRMNHMSITATEEDEMKSQEVLKISNSIIELVQKKQDAIGRIKSWTVIILALVCGLWIYSLGKHIETA